MDEWQVEMQEIQRSINGLRARQGDAVIIAELEAELRILQSLYLTSLDVFEAGEADAEVRGGFAALHLGDWNFANVYSFVYERALEIEPGRRELSSLVPEIDYIDLIRKSA
ncbi:MAG TPA: hypothetical protein VG329_08200 [Candidatus Dormibacteraeota bacterium]|nr:hypothetical protein [Candidatus Dormibacteraeota bacterium]